MKKSTLLRTATALVLATCVALLASTASARNGTLNELRPLMQKFDSAMLPTTTVSASAYTIQEGDSVIDVTRTSTGTCALSIPVAAVKAGKFYLIKDAARGAATYNITISTAGADTIDGAATYVMNASGQAVMLYSDGANWSVVASYLAPLSRDTITLTAPTTVEYLLASHPLTDFNTSGEHHLYEGVSGKSATVTRVVVHSCSGTLNQVQDAIVQFGCNHGTSNDVIAATTFTKPTSATTYQIISATGIGTGAAESTACLYGTNGTFALNVTTPVTASTTCTVDVYGYLF